MSQTKTKQPAFVDEHLKVKMTSGKYYGHYMHLLPIPYLRFGLIHNRFDKQQTEVAEFLINLYESRKPPGALVLPGGYYQGMLLQDVPIPYIQRCIHRPNPESEPLPPEIILEFKRILCRVYRYAGMPDAEIIALFKKSTPHVYQQKAKP